MNQTDKMPCPDIPVGEADNKQISKNYDRSKVAKCCGKKLDKEENENCIRKWRGKGWEPGKISLMEPEGSKRTIAVCIWEKKDP